MSRKNRTPEENARRAKIAYGGSQRTLLALGAHSHLGGYFRPTRTPPYALFTDYRNAVKFLISTVIKKSRHYVLRLRLYKQAQ